MALAMVFFIQFCLLHCQRHVEMGIDKFSDIQWVMDYFSDIEQEIGSKSL